MRTANQMMTILGEAGGDNCFQNLSLLLCISTCKYLMSHPHRRKMNAFRSKKLTKGEHKAKNKLKCVTSLVANKRAISLVVNQKIDKELLKVEVCSLIVTVGKQCGKI